MANMHGTLSGIARGLLMSGLATSVALKLDLVWSLTTEMMARRPVLQVQWLVLAVLIETALIWMLAVRWRHAWMCIVALAAIAVLVAVVGRPGSCGCLGRIDVGWRATAVVSALGGALACLGWLAQSTSSRDRPESA